MNKEKVYTYGDANGYDIGWGSGCGWGHGNGGGGEYCVSSGYGYGDGNGNGDGFGSGRGDDNREGWVIDDYGNQLLGRHLTNF